MKKTTKYEIKFVVATFLFIIGIVFYLKNEEKIWSPIEKYYSSCYDSRNEVINAKGRVMTDRTFNEISAFNSNGVAYYVEYHEFMDFTRGFVDVSGNDVYEKAAEVVDTSHIDSGCPYYIDNDLFIFQSYDDVIILHLETGDKYVVENASFTMFDYMSNGLFPLRSDDKGLVGYVNKYGEWIIEPKFMSANGFSEGLAAVRDVNELYGYIDETGEYVIEPQFTDATFFSEDCALVTDKDTGLEGYIDKTGKYVIEPRYRGAGSFSEGLAYVKIASNEEDAYIDKNGEVVLEPGDYGFGGEFSHGLAYVYDGKTETYGFIDKSGELVIPCQYSYVCSFTEDGVTTAGTEESGSGIIDMKGNWVIPPQHYLYFRDFHNGYTSCELNSGEIIEYDLSDGAEWKKDYVNRHKLAKFLHSCYKNRYNAFAVICILILIYFTVLMIKYFKAIKKHPPEWQ